MKNTNGKSKVQLKRTTVFIAPVLDENWKVAATIRSTSKTVIFEKPLKSFGLMNWICNPINLQRLDFKSSIEIKI